MKQSINQAQIVCEYWLDKDTYFVATDEFKLNNDFADDLHGVAWGEIWADDNNSVHFGINIYEDEGPFKGGYLDTLYEYTDGFIPFPAELKKAMLDKMNEAITNKC